MNGYFLTDKGQVRSHNEDAGGIFFNQHSQVLAVVADGMGGHRAGDVASNIATTSLHNKWFDAQPISTAEEAESWLQETVKSVNQELFQYALNHEECKGMGTTIVAAICTQEFVSVAHIGDSRCYLSNEFGFKQITEDHSLVNELVRAGQISKEDAEHHPRKNVLLKALGTESETSVDINTVIWEEDDKLLLCSDGLSNKMADEELVEFVQEPLPLEKAAEKLVTIANERGGEDNISLVLVHHDAPAEEGVS
ncbi:MULTISPECIES: Stp1/IreP family PP2C-type Ser/Thr phosphatase [Pontibacillus]|uniref:Stp1/IreP family PP2C-type Ser/Thr phosphatase n=1 Tax=Pontibacillus chungwhensis TaxID=265426 RepID=A0ABY8V1U9_9BACI|nr:MULTISPECIES: Stp1/IreP family PP2C-type Ser/Thr phosphatase [Pontibacillus]MCD5322634.1 Stp1/IreP family PP2C-type Ser/Thr phosphatase [Pontibacillus sp. HN14]WIF99915.1 Stp1/IreP family PP2C-type Ser/Thr phosphatase [Pontibacillus chungwhensis]